MSIWTRQARDARGILSRSAKVLTDSDLKQSPTASGGDDEPWSKFNDSIILKDVGQ
jgi:hypothetical protein